MTALIAALAGALIVAGVLLGVASRLPSETLNLGGGPSRPTRAQLSTRVAGIDRRTKILLAVGLGVGVVVYLLTGWLIAVLLAPVAVAGLPTLLSAPPSATRVDKLEGLEEWTRALSGVLTAGVGLEDAMRASLRSAPDSIRPEVTTLVKRIRARSGTEDALRAFADDVDDSTSDLVAYYLILGARRRGPGLASVLESLAESVAADVQARRDIEADRAKPRTTARLVTLITLAALGFLVLTGDYVAPYNTPIGQVLLLLFLSAYVGLLIWMRNMAKGEQIPRFLGKAAQGGAR